MNAFVKNVLMRLSIYSLIIAGFFLVSCGTKVVKVDPELKPYEDWYFTLVEKSCKANQYVPRDNYIIKFVPDYKNAEWKIGECTNWGLISKRMLTINSAWWDTMSELYKKKLMAHELTHCFFNEPHSKNPNSFMYFELTYSPSEESLEAELADYFRGKCSAP